MISLSGSLLKKALLASFLARFRRAHNFLVRSCCQPEYHFPLKVCGLCRIEKTGSGIQLEIRSEESKQS